MADLTQLKSFILDNIPSEYRQNSTNEMYCLIAFGVCLYVISLIVIKVISSVEHSLQKSKKDREIKSGLYTFDANGNKKLAIELPEHLQEKKKKQKEELENLTIYSSPIRTIVYFTLISLRTTLWLLSYVLSHPITIFCVLPAFFAWFIGSMIPGDHLIYCDLALKYTELTVWWVGLGVLSSIGLGTGMHSGVLFLFPHIIRVSVQSHTCGNTLFDSYADMWFRNPTPAFACISPTPGVEATFFEIFLKVLIPSLLWGAGTAIGEIPPYALSRAARLAGERNSEFDDLDLESEPKTAVDKMKFWMVTFLQKYGFLGVLLFSAYPNMMFDLCGICCGHFLMPFWSFFGATFIGKAVIKVNGQSAFIIAIASPPHLKTLLSSLKLVLSEKLYEQVVWGVDLAYAKFGLSGSTASSGEEPEEGLLKMVWGYFMFALIGWFALSCVNQFAQSYQSDLNDQEIENELIKNAPETKKNK